MHAVRPDERGFSLMEVIVATVIATIAVMGLAYTFGMGRGFINRFEVGRAAVAAAQGALEIISTRPLNDTLVTIGEVKTRNFVVNGRVLGTERWIVNWKDDPADGTALTSPADKDTTDLRIAYVSVVFQDGSQQDSVRLTRLLPVQ